VDLDLHAAIGQRFNGGTCLVGVADKQHTALARLGVVLLAEAIGDDVFVEHDHLAARFNNLTRAAFLTVLVQQMREQYSISPSCRTH